MNNTGTVTAADALMVLQKAVGLAAPLECAASNCVTTTTLVGDQCFDDEDCAIFGPGFEHCGGANGETCVECNFDTECADGSKCYNYACVLAECVPQ